MKKEIIIKTKLDSNSAYVIASFITGFLHTNNSQACVTKDMREILNSIMLQLPKRLKNKMKREFEIFERSQPEIKEAQDHIKKTFADIQRKEMFLKALT